MPAIDFVDPVTEAPITGYSFPEQDAGTISTAFPVRVRYGWGLSGSGMNSFALLFFVQNPLPPYEWGLDIREFTIEVTGVVNPNNDPLFLGAPQAARRVGRLDLPPLRAGCAYDLLIRFAPTLRGSASRSTYNWHLSYAIDEMWEPASTGPDTPIGVLTGLGTVDVTEWITAPAITPGTDKVTTTAGDLVLAGTRALIAAGDIVLDQNDGASEALATGQEYIAGITAAAGGSWTVTKGLRAASGTALLPLLPVGEAPLCWVRVPYGGVIATITTLALSGRLAVRAGTGLEAIVSPGRASLPGSLAKPAVEQTVAVVDDATTTVSIRPDGIAATGVPERGWAPLADVTAAAGVVTGVVDRRVYLLPPPLRLAVAGTETVETAAAQAFVPEGWTLHRAELAARVPSTGATGSTDVALNLDGSAFATASLAAQAAAVDAVPTAPSGAAGWITLDVTAVTAGGTPAEDLEVLLWIVPLPA